MIDSLKTSSLGIAGSSVYWVEWVPPLFSALAALATLVYMLIKIWGEIKYGKGYDKKGNNNS